MHASLARERDHRSRADADVGERAAVKTYEELGGFAPPLAQPRRNSQDAQDVEDQQAPDRIGLLSAHVGHLAW
jgi:hypothetical protein